MESTTRIVDTSSGVDITITNRDQSRVAEIRKRAGRIAEATSASAAGTHRELDRWCQVVVENTKVTAQNVDGGVKLSVRALKSADLEWLRGETRKRDQRDSDGRAKPHGALLVDSPTAAEVWVDGVDSGYQTPTDAILLPPGKHEVAVQDGAGSRGRPTTVVVVLGGTQRLLLRPVP